MMLPLHGVRVLDLSWIIAGPTATRFMAMMGAEVIKVGSFRRPDPSYSGPAFHSYNQSKSYVSINLSSEKGVELVKELASLSDVVVENFATGVMERRGLGYEELASVNPTLIMISSSGVGHTGPKKDQVAYGSLLQHYTGWNSQSGHPGGEPIKGGLWADPWVGMELAMITTACLSYRAATGSGQYVDFSMAEALVESMPISVLHEQMTGTPKLPIGNDDEFDILSDVFSCRGDDEWIAVSVSTRDQWDSLCDLLDIPGLRSADLTEKSVRKDMTNAISEWSAQRDDYDSVSMLQKNGIPSAPSWDVSRVYRDQFLRERNYLVEMETSDGNLRYMPGVPWWFDDTSSPVIKAAPELGRDNQRVFKKLLGIGDREYDDLTDSGVLG
ncbi:MAG: CoA transferase [SAR202 cluster bacterium]|nr:CoA transferase [SAR202 cluster bacterium]